VNDDFLSRWSRRKSAVRKGEKIAEPPKAAEPPPAAEPAGEAGRDAPAAGAVAAQPQKLPPVESLTLESDFSPFMKPEVDPGTRRAALKVLLRDPRFNVMDGLDVYIDDYSKPDPLPPEWLDQLSQLKDMGHYVEKAVEGTAAEPSAEASEPAAELQKAIPEQPVEPLTPDTAELQNPGAGVGESEGAGK
jgi:hypothetical protein